MNRETRWHRFTAIAAILMLALVACDAAQDVPEVALEEASEASAPSERWLAARAAETQEALAVLKRMSDLLGKQKQFSVVTEIGYDAMQVSGQKLEFGGSRTLTLRRPDRLRIEGRPRHGGEQTLYFDGTHISVSFPEENAYSQVEKPGTLDDAIDYLVDDLGTPAPLADLLYSDFYAGVEDKIEWGVIVGDAIIGGVSCQHVAFRGDKVDAQFWIENGDRPLPRRIVLTFHEADGSPQFWSRLHDWNLSPQVSDAVFAFTPAEGAERIPFAPRNVAELQAEAR